MTRNNEKCGGNIAGGVCRCIKTSWRPLLVLVLVSVVLIYVLLPCIMTRTSKHVPLKPGFHMPTAAFDMSFPGFPAVCNDTIPAFGNLTLAGGKGEDVVEVTHTACCDGVGSRGASGTEPKTVCRTAPKPLRLPLRLVKAALASAERTVDLRNLDLLRSLSFVTGTSADHFTESLVQVKSIQKYFPGNQIIYWDLGLSAEQAATLKTLCRVTYKRFDFFKYPKHVATLKTYAFKPLVIMESFSEFTPVLWWVDASVRFTSSNVDRVLSLLKERHGMVMFRDAVHSVWAATFPQMYFYVAVNDESLKYTTTATGASFIVANTRELFSTFLFWFYACALDRRCIAPVMAPEPCQFGPTINDFGKCHRFDQSLMTLLVTNIWGFNSDGYRFAEDMFYIERSEKGDKEALRCPSGEGHN